MKTKTTGFVTKFCKHWFFLKGFGLVRVFRVFCGRRLYKKADVHEQHEKHEN